MKLNKLASAIGLSLITSFGVNAAIVSVDGIQWDTDALTDFQANSVLSASGNIPGGPVGGVGNVVILNSSANFCVGGLGSCELTFSFDGFTTGSNAGTLTLYSHTAPNYDPTTGTGATDGNVFLTLTSQDDATVAPSGITGALLNVTGGAAASFFDTNGTSNGSDLIFTTSWQEGGSIPGFNLQGSSDFFGTTSGPTAPSPTPEPTSLLLLSIGLLGFGAKRKLTAK